MRRPQLPPDRDPAGRPDADPGEQAPVEYDALDEIAWRAQRTRSSADAYATPAADRAAGGPPDGGHPAKPKRRRRRGRRAFAWIAFVVVALLAITIGYGVFNYSALTSNITHVDAIDTAQQPATDIDGAAQNILLVGDDHRPANASAAELAQLHAGPDDGENNTDTMMILHIPSGSGTPSTLISLPRDSWVAIPGYGHDKLNAAFADGQNNAAKGEDPDAAGARLLIRTVQNLTGLTIDHYVRVSLLGFYDIANALGPIQVCLKHAVNDPYSGADFPAGISTLDAAQTLAFVRQRHGLPNGDLDREVRQQYFLSVEAHNLLSAGTILNPVKLHNAMTAIGSAIETDPDLQPAQLAWKLRSPGALRSTTIPVSGTPTIYPDGTPVSIVQVDTAAMPAFIAGVIGQPDAYTSAHAASPGDVTVTVLNGGGADGAATAATHTFASAGFHTGTPADADETATTTIRYAPGQESQAKAVAAYLPGATLERTENAHTVTVVLGADGAMPAKPSTGSAPKKATSTPKPSQPGTSYSGTTCID